jgi:YidC/Oxa1 family membrane protein insertase
MTLPLANVLQPLIDFCEAIMSFWHDTVGFSWGLSIILLTVVIRLIILPLTYRQVKGMQEMKRLQPQMAALKERYGDDRQRLQQEQMKMFQEHGVNPLSSCLPILLQFPFFISLFYMLRHDLRIDVCGQSKVPCGQIPGSHGESFLFIPDITAKATGAVLITLIILYVGSQLVSGLISTFAADRSQQIMILVLPIIFVPVILGFPAGLIVYWITTNVWTIGQQLAIKRWVPQEPAPALAGAGKAAVKAGNAGKQKGDSKPAAKPAKAGKPAKADGGANGAAATKAPPPGPRKKKKRSGRRR